MDKQIRVLVVDDDPRISHLILKILAQGGYAIDVSFSGADALQIIKK